MSADNPWHDQECADIARVITRETAALLDRRNAKDTGDDNEQ